MIILTTLLLTLTATVSSNLNHPLLAEDDSLESGITHPEGPPVIQYATSKRDTRLTRFGLCALGTAALMAGGTYLTSSSTPHFTPQLSPLRDTEDREFHEGVLTIYGGAGNCTLGEETKETNSWIDVGSQSQNGCYDIKNHKFYVNGKYQIFPHTAAISDQNSKIIIGDFIEDSTCDTNENTIVWNVGDLVSLFSTYDGSEKACRYLCEGSGASWNLLANLRNCCDHNIANGQCSVSTSSSMFYVTDGVRKALPPNAYQVVADADSQSRNRHWKERKALEDHLSDAKKHLDPLHNAQAEAVEATKAEQDNEEAIKIEKQTLKNLRSQSRPLQEKRDSANQNRTDEQMKAKPIFEDINKTEERLEQDEKEEAKLEGRKL